MSVCLSVCFSHPSKDDYWILLSSFFRLGLDVTGLGCHESISNLGFAPTPYYARYVVSAMALNSYNFNQYGSELIVRVIDRKNFGLEVIYA